jgi:prepilin-type N-terminal cleavage/methylation domain-containing protein
MKTRTSGGFTLVELLLSISIIVMVAAMVAGMMNAFSKGSVVEKAVNEIKSYLLLAKQEAVQMGKPVAVFFVPPTDLTPNSRMILLEARDQLPAGTDVTQLSNWRVIPGEYGATVRQGLEIRRKGDTSGQAESFCIVYTPGGTIDNRCPANNLSLSVGPTKTSNARMTPAGVAVNRSTGTITQLERD